MTPHAPDSEEIARLVRRLDDERQIRNLVARLVHVADHGGLDEYMTFFTEDAVWEGPASTQTPRVRVRNDGAAAIRADREGRRRSGAHGAGAHVWHMNTALWVEFDGPDQATAHSYFGYVRNAHATPELGVMGRYVDTLRRTPDGWKLARREVSLVE